MGCYLNETDAKEHLKNIIEQTTTDYKLFVRNRLYKKANTKQVEFAIIVLPQNAEPIFNKLARLKLDNCSDKILELNSSIYLDEAQRTIKDLIIVKTEVKI